MGSCPSKRKKSLDQRQEACNQVEETKLETKVSGIVENTESECYSQANSTKEDKLRVVPSSAADEEHTIPKIQQSFSWLASTPVGWGPPANQPKEKVGKPMENRAKARNVMKYRNERYVKSWQHSE